MMSDRKNVRGYVFGAALASMAMGGVRGLMETVRAATTNAIFTFENVNNTFFPSGISYGTKTTAVGVTVTTSTNTTYASYTGSSGQSVGPFIAESGTGSAYGFHAGTSTYSTPVGNGSAHSLSSTNWAVGDYYQFNVPTTAIDGVVVSFDQSSSSTGPKDFELLGIDQSAGSTYTLGVYAVPYPASTNSTGGTGTVGFASGSSNSAFNVSTTVTVAGLLNNPSVEFRLQLVDLTSEGGSTVGTSGTDRVDNFTVVSTPEPSSLVLAGAGISGLLLRRKRSTRRRI